MRRPSGPSQHFDGLSHLGGDDIEAYGTAAVARILRAVRLYGAVL
jgi:hypothetical protein